MNKHPRIEIFKDVKGGFRFRVIAANDKIVAQSEGYTTKAMCKKGIVALINTTAIVAEYINWSETAYLHDLTK